MRMSSKLQTLIYDGSFYATCCHVCKKGKSEVSLKCCARCRLISYCSVDHQRKHWPAHKLVCSSVYSILKRSVKKSLFEDDNWQLTLAQWCSLRVKYMACVEIHIRRKLYKSEREMFFFPRVCIVCKKFNDGDLIDCKKCQCASYCTVAHKNSDGSHFLYCTELKLCMELDNKANKLIPNFTINSCDRYSLLPNNMRSFIEKHLIFSDEVKNIPVYIAFPWASEYFTCSLTVLYAIEGKSIPMECFSLHVVGASFLECTFIGAWESILHWMPHIKKLKLTFIGPEVIESSDISLCDNCKTAGKSIEFSFHPNTFYHSFAASSSYSIPNVISAFNSGIHEYESSNDTWRLSVSHMLKFPGIPLVLTSYTYSEAEADLKKIQNIKNDIETKICCMKNPFSSCRPYRDWESDPLKTFVANNYLTVVIPKNSDSTKF